MFFTVVDPVIFPMWEPTHWKRCLANFGISPKFKSKYTRKLNIFVDTTHAFEKILTCLNSLLKQLDLIKFLIYLAGVARFVLHPVQQE